MKEFFSGLLDPKGFPARWHCGQWTDFHGWLYIVSDLLIWSAYFAIPFLLLRFISQRRDVPFNRLFWLFGLFIFACGATHLLDALIFWLPLYRLNGLLLLVTAVASWGTVWALAGVLPQALLLKTPADLERIVKDRTTELAAANQQLQEVAAQLRHRNAEFSTLTNAMPQLAWMAETDGQISWYNQQWYDYTGLSFADLGGINWQQHIHPDDFAATAAAWQHALATGEPLTTLRNRWKRAANGEYRWHLVRAVPLHDEATGAIRLWVGTNTDIHAQQVQQQELERVNADLNTFVYTASHDLKTPIHNIEALLEELREELAPVPVPADVATLLTLMRGAVDRFKGTIGQLTEVAKLQHLSEAPTTAVDLAALVEEVRQDLRPLFAATGGQLHLDVAACPRLVFAEKNLRSVVHNLLSNALKYRHPDRVPAVWLRTYPASADGSRSAVLEVEDNGLGLALGPAEERKLFGLFERLHDHVEGSGLGLFMVKKIVENAGGRIEVSSRLGQGTVFRLHLPAPRPALQEEG
ncbi:hypothetical protein BEN49_17575 [Hymenobacter coccineus]|uniref:histidine kinase n=1 Tax=Hymenobacter coccineus TaxID=1908235 RepID=A0A1G1TMF3_9BACT|nr:hypothetical protein BEN49_17575 [Hymenobacter coccineus]